MPKVPVIKHVTPFFPSFLKKRKNIDLNEKKDSKSVILNEVKKAEVKKLKLTAIKNSDSRRSHFKW